MRMLFHWRINIAYISRLHKLEEKVISDFFRGIAPEAVRHWSGKYTEAAKQPSNLPREALKKF